MTTLIRDARDTDLPAIVAIYNASIPGRLATADTEPVTLESRQAWFAARDPQRRPIRVLELAGEVQGWISLKSFYEGRPAYDATSEVSLYLAPAVQGQGWGGRLLDGLIADGPRLGVAELLGCLFAHNGPSQRLFRSRGFGEVGLLPAIARLDGIPRDLVILQRTLVDPQPT